MTPIKGLVSLVLALAAALATAETVYKYQRPDGSTVYSDVLLRGAKLIGRFELVPVPPPAKGEPARLERGRRSSASRRGWSRSPESAWASSASAGAAA